MANFCYGVIDIESADHRLLGSLLGHVWACSRKDAEEIVNASIDKAFKIVSASSFGKPGRQMILSSPLLGGSPPKRAGDSAKRIRRSFTVLLAPDSAAIIDKQPNRSAYVAELIEAAINYHR